MECLVIGNGIAGISAAYAIRRFNKEADIRIITKEPHPAYSACLLADYLSGELSRDRVFIREFSDYLRENIKLTPEQKALTLDTKQQRVLLQSESMSYDKLIIATGSRPAVPPIKGTDKKGVFTLKSLEDADMIHGWDGRTVVVVGSGPVGIEVCLAFKKRGLRVFLVELLDQILPQVFDEYPASIIRDILQSRGIEVSTREKICEIVGGNKVEGVTSDRRNIKCDTVILATGMKPEIALIEGILALGNFGGILVDDRMRTSVPNIYACGDCVEAKSLFNGHPVLSLLWHNAWKQGEIAGSNAVEVTRIYPGSLSVTGVDVFGVQAVSIGSIETGIEGGSEVVETEEDGRYQRLILSTGALVGVQSINWSENLGGLLAAIIRGESLKSPRDLTAWRKPLLNYSKRLVFGRKFTWH